MGASPGAESYGVMADLGPLSDEVLTDRPMVDGMTPSARGACASLTPSDLRHDLQRGDGDQQGSGGPLVIVS